MKKYLFFLITLGLISGSCENSESGISDKGGITGIVTDKLSNEPISGVSIVLAENGLSKVSGSDGRFEFQEIEPQQYNVQASTSGYKYNVRRTEVIAGQTAKCDIQLEPVTSNNNDNNSNTDDSNNFPLAGAFHNANSLIENAHFIVSNHNGRTVNDILIIVTTGNASGSFNINLNANQTYTIVYQGQSHWQTGDYITIKTEGKTRIWTY